MKESGIWFILIIISLSPLLFWIPLTHSDVLTSLSQVTALVGLTMYAINIVLSSFVPQWKKHHVIGGFAFILIMLHPLFLAASLLPAGLKFAVDYILPGENWRINLGIISLFLSMSLLFLTFFIVLPYRYWKLTHKFMGVAFIVGSIHGVLAESNISREPILKIYMLIIISVAYIFWFKHSVIDAVIKK